MIGKTHAILLAVIDRAMRGEKCQLVTKQTPLQVSETLLGMGYKSTPTENSVVLEYGSGKTATIYVSAPASDVHTPWGYSLWKYMSDTYGLTLLESELLELIRKVEELKLQKPPIAELEQAVPLVMYFKTLEDREGFIKDVEAAKPTFEMRRLE